jgi:serine/threonine protein phosphatase PrpC
MIEFAASTHSGLIRSQNEDCYSADPELGLWLVADGVGGHAFGEVASAIVNDTTASAYRESENLVEAMHCAHKAVLEEIARRDENLGMGSTVVALVLKDNDYEISWVGDSRAYLWDGESLKQLTRDHTHVYDLVDQGAISIADAATHPERHVLTQSMGVFDDMALAPGSVVGQLQANQQILLCSDGLTDELSDNAVASQLRRNSSTQEQVDGLISAALTSGGRDNVTVIVVGSASTGNPVRKTRQFNDLETTQEIGQAVEDNVQSRTDHRRKLWLAAAVIIILAVITWM